MVARTANVNVRIEPDVKERAEAILERLGISASAFINMSYKQVILRKGIPYDVTIPSSLMTRDSMTDDEFDEMMREGLAQAKKGDTIPFDKAFDSLATGF